MQLCTQCMLACILMSSGVSRLPHSDVGGDQMTVARTRGSQRIRSNANREKQRLKGFTPLIEDWHAKMCLLGVYHGSPCTMETQFWLCIMATSSNYFCASKPFLVNCTLHFPLALCVGHLETSI